MANKRNYHPISPPQQTKTPTTIKRKSVRTRQKSGYENVTGSGYENVPRSGYENVTMRNRSLQARKRAYYLEEAFHLSAEQQPVRANAGNVGEPEPASRTPVATQTALDPNIGRNATKAEQDLVLMIAVLRTLLGNRTTSTIWQQHMQSFGGAGWSKPSFKRRVKTLKNKKWIRIVGLPDANFERVPEGSLFEVTEIAPGDSSPQVYMNGAADAAAKAARELLERLSKPAA